MKTLVVVSALLLLFVSPSLLMAHGEEEESPSPTASTTPTPANPCDVPFPDVAAQTAFLTVANTECKKVPDFVVDPICRTANDKATKACGDECARHHKIGITPPTQCPAKIRLGAAIVKRVEVGEDCKVICVAVPVPCACLDP
jgi:hypothetical protein